MRFGLGLPQHGDCDLHTDIRKVATTAEQEGFSSLWVYERLVYPVNPRQPLYDVPDLPWQPAYKNSADPLTVLTAAAACTETVRLGQSVLVASLHQPVRLAVTLATLDEIAGGGRVVAGLGTGWMYDEYDAVGVPRTRRGADLTETIETLRAVWGDEPVTYHGSTVAMDEVFVGRNPRRQIPIMIGGGFSEASRRRIAMYADGFLGTAESGAATVATVRQLETLAAQEGRPDLHLEINNRANITLLAEPFAGDERPTFVGDFDQVVSDLAENARAGVDELIIDLGLQDPYPGVDRILETSLALKAAVEKAAG